MLQECIVRGRVKNIKKNLDDKKFRIVVGAGSSGPTTKWGAKNFYDLINKLDNSGDYYFFILCGVGILLLYTLSSIL